MLPTLFIFKGYYIIIVKVIYNSVFKCIFNSTSITYWCDFCCINYWNGLFYYIFLFATPVRYKSIPPTPIASTFPSNSFIIEIAFLYLHLFQFFVLDTFPLKYLFLPSGHAVKNQCLHLQFFSCTIFTPKIILGL